MTQPRECASAVDRLGTDRFLVRRRLGAGSWGPIYEAWDRRRDELVAVRLLVDASAGALCSWRRLVDRLQQIAHPAIVRFHEVGTEDDVAWVSMERLSGPDLSTAIRSFPVGVLRTGDPSGEDPSISRLRAVLAEVAEALEALHAAGLVHANLKPSNVRLRATGGAVLLDPVPLDDSDEVWWRRWAPTDYTAPELVGRWRSRIERGDGTAAGGGPIDPSSDLFGCGALLYQALVGIVPGPGHDRSPSERARGVPEDLDRICAELLRPDPGGRPDARSLRRLLAGPAAVSAAAPGEIERSRQLSRRIAPLFVGRRQELAELQRAVERLPEGRGELIWLSGPSGIGKTSLLRRFAEPLEHDERTRLLWGHSHRQPGPTYEVFRELIAGLEEKKRPGSADGRSEDTALGRLFPQLSPSAGTGDARGLSPEGLRQRAFAELRRHFEEASRRRLLILVLEDLQWADRDTASLFTALAARPMPPYLIVASYRSDWGASPFFDALPPELRARRRIELGPLSAGDATTLARGLLESRPDPPRGELEPFARQLAEAAAGNPFVIEVLCRVARPGASRLDGDPLGPWLDDTDRTSRAVVELLAVAGRPLPTDLVRRLLAESGEGVGEELDRTLVSLRELGVLRIAAGSSERLQLGHDRLRERISASLSTPCTRRRHAQLARGLEREPSLSSVGTVAAHWSHAEDDARAARFAVEAAEEALEQLAFDRAAQLLNLALELGASGIDSTQLRARLGDTLALAGRSADAASAYLEAVRRGASSRVLELQLRAAEQLLVSGHSERGLRVLRHVFRGLDLALPGERSSPLADRLQRWLLRRRGLAFDWRAEGELQEKERLRVDALWSAAVGLRTVDPAEASRFQTRHLRRALQAGEPRRVLRALLLEVASSSAGGTRSAERTGELVRAVTRLSQDVGDPASAARAALAATLEAVGRGEWARAVDIARQASTLLEERCVGVAWERRICEDLLLQGWNGLGAFREIEERVPTRLEEARELDDRQAETQLGIWWARCLLIDDRPGAADEELRSLERRRSGAADLFPRVNAQLVGCEVALYRGDPEGWDRLRERWPEVVGLRMLEVQLLRIRLAALRARAALIRARTEPASHRPAYLAIAERELDRIEKEATPWGDAIACSLRGVCAERRGDLDRALARYREAEERTRGARVRVLADLCRLRRGELLGGEEGARLCQTANDELRSAGVGSPERLAALFLPRG